MHAAELTEVSPLAGIPVWPGFLPGQGFPSGRGFLQGSACRQIRTPEPVSIPVPVFIAVPPTSFTSILTHPVSFASSSCSHACSAGRVRPMSFRLFRSFLRSRQHVAANGKGPRHTHSPPFVSVSGLFPPYGPTISPHTARSGQSDSRNPGLTHACP